MYKLTWNDKEVMLKIDRELSDDTGEAAEIVAAKARILAPVKTGKLRDSIIVKKSKFKGGGHIVQAGGSGAYHAPLIELGTINMEAKPYLRPALEKSRGQIRRLMKLK